MKKLGVGIVCVFALLPVLAAAQPALRVQVAPPTGAVRDLNRTIDDAQRGLLRAERQTYDALYHQVTVSPSGIRSRPTTHSRTSSTGSATNTTLIPRVRSNGSLTDRSAAQNTAPAQPQVQGGYSLRSRSHSSILRRNR